uniref:Uncharacterized protein n=1 Tax=Anguilla anguilla TaxID=7936 RepID=A0A0E9PPE2_ANGAN
MLSFCFFVFLFLVLFLSISIYPSIYLTLLPSLFFSL